jgi:two-component system chemotaxis response regulator CheY
MSPSTSATEVVDVSQLHVLMVDDEQISRTVACNLLRKVGYSVSAFATGAAALAALQDPQLRKKYKWLLILTDMMMPPPDGIDLLNYVRADPELFHVPVVMMSSNEHRGTVYECVKAGVDDFITKVRAAQAMPRVCRSLVADARVPNHRTGQQVYSV